MRSPNIPPPQNKSECSWCGSQRLRKDRSGHANDSELLFYKFDCYDCRRSSIGVFVMLPPGATSLGALDGDQRRRNAEMRRKSKGWNKATPQRSRYITDDKVVVSARVIKGKRRGTPL